MESLDFSFQDLPPVVHIGGTNGKGSTARYLENLFQEANYKAHRYSSPHVISPCERIVLRGSQVEDNTLRATYRHVEKKYPEASYFEKMTATAFVLFRDFQADVVLLEVGLGGRLDATNLVHPILSVITPISLDHTEHLGKDLATIAGEKAGIIKPDSICLTAQQEPPVMEVLERTCKERGAQFFFPEEKFCLDYKEQNLNLAKEAAKILSSTGFGRLREVKGSRIQDLQGRFQRLSIPLPKSSDLEEIILDGAHNVSGGLALKAFLDKNPMKTSAIICMHDRKDGEAFQGIFRSWCEEVIFMSMEEEKRQWVSELKRILLLDIGASHRVVLTGSLHFAGEVLRAYIQ